MIAPASTAIGQDLNVTSTFQLQLIFSIFLLAFVVGPLFIAPLSEVGLPGSYLAAGDYTDNSGRFMDE